MADRRTHILAAKADGLSEKLAQIALNVIDPPKKKFFERAFQKELAEVMFWLEPESLERRMMNSVTFARPSKLRLYLLHHILLDVVAYYAIPYKEKAWYELWPFQIMRKEFLISSQ